MVTREEYFWARVLKTDACWLWRGPLTRKGDKGYGSMPIKDRIKKLAHRFSYELHKGPIPEGLQIDHLCRVRACVNPDHLEVVTPSENTLRGWNAGRRPDYCKEGHLLSEKNVYVNKRGHRSCRHCRRNHSRKYDVERRGRDRVGEYRPRVRKTLEV